MSHEDELAWYDQAACQGLGWEEFFGSDDLAAARRICATCPVRVNCMRFAINNDITSGIWGGLSPRERRRIRLPSAWVA